MRIPNNSLVDSTLVSDQEDQEEVFVPQRLMVGTGQQVVTHMLPREGIATVGRAPEATIRIEDPSVSRVHVRLHVGPSIRVEDLGSANGTRIGGARLRANELTPISAGQVVELGNSWMLIANAPANRSVTRQIAVPIEGPPPPRPGAAADDGNLIMQDPAVVKLHRLIERAALGDITVLLLGETGVGKEVFARRIHELSPRADQPFLGLNCAALAASLLESELFGYERGAFTGAAQTKVGLLESAEGGTLLLDEVGEMPPAIQVKLLRVLEERQVLRIGGTRARPIDVRVLSATNRNLEADVEAGTFRRDLFFRLNSITVEIPPLRERPSEIEPLGRRFAALAAKRLGQQPPEIEAPVWDRLRGYRWPGNIRQLRNVMDRAVLLAEGGRITLDLIPTDTYVGPAPRAAAAPPVSPAPASAAPVSSAPAGHQGASERERIMAALDRCAGNQTRAAALLGISRRTLVSKLAALNVPRPRKGDPR